MSRAAMLALAVLAVAPCHAEELGRLFFTPAERAALDAQRSSGAAAATVATAPVPLRIDGYVRRAGGRTTVWVNGEASGGELPGRGRLKVGATLDSASGEVRDLIGASQVRVQR